MSSLLFELIPDTIIGIISPVQIIMCILLLISKKPLINSISYTVGYLIALCALGVIVAVFFQNVHPSSTTALVGAVIQIVFGILFFILALRMLLKAPDPNAPPPHWMQGLDTLSARKAVALGMSMLILNLVNVTAYIDGLVLLVTSKTIGGLGDKLIVLFVFLLGFNLELFVPILLYALFPHQATPLLNKARKWLTEHTRVITIGTLVFFGIVFLLKGLGKLS